MANSRCADGTSSIAWLALAIAGTIASTGCNRPSASLADPPPPVVTVSVPVERPIVENADFTGRTDAIESVEVRARVFGYLDKIHFREGAEVKKGALLFEIDPRSYQADLAKAEAQVAAVEATLKRLNQDYNRIQRLSRTDAASREELDKIVGQRTEAEATLRGAQSQVDRAKLDLDFTKIKAPIGGRISRAYVTEGNLVQGGSGQSTLLTTIVTTDPMYAFFDIDERTMLHIQKMIREGKFKSARDDDSKVPVYLGLANEEGYPHQGIINFVDNRVDPSTGTMRIRGVFPNPDTNKSGTARVLTPGLFVRIRLPLGEPHPALEVTERALGTDQGQKFIYVVNDQNEVVYRPVAVGPLENGLRVIEKGLKAGEKVIVNGLQRVRPGVRVDPKLVEMPVPVSEKVAAAKGGS